MLRFRHRQPEDTAISDYIEEMACFQIQHGLNSMDLTPEQARRFRTIEAARGDAAVAKRLIFGRRLYREGRLTDHDAQAEARRRAWPEPSNLEPLIQRAVRTTGPRPVGDEGR